MDNNLINKLPFEIVNIISSYLPVSCTLWLNKKIYTKYHYKIKNVLLSKPHYYNNYVLDMVRNDNYFVFEFIIQENLNKWTQVYKKNSKNNKVFYKNIFYPNYYYFLLEFCLENNSTNCKNLLKSYFNKTGLSKNQHKRNSILNIRWKI
jgi:hypothetical protein